MPMTRLSSMVGKDVFVKILSGDGLNGNLSAVTDVDILLKAPDGTLFVIPFSAIGYVQLAR